MPAKLATKLPKPDDFQNYWLRERGQAPAILRSMSGGYFATTEDGAIVDGRCLRKFKTPLEALAAIEAAR